MRHFREWTGLGGDAGNSYLYREFVRSVDICGQRKLDASTRGSDRNYPMTKIVQSLPYVR
jgi:hypothetical protein